jgi:hypothetical protein
MRAGSQRLSTLASTLVLVSLADGRPVRAAVPLDAENVELRLTFFDPCHTVPGLGPGTLREIQRLLRPAGVRVTGSNVAAVPDANRGVFVVLLPFDPSRRRTQPIGGVARSENGRQLTVWAFPPWVAAGLGLDLERLARWSDRDHQQFEKALAVVVVHELGHALAQARHRRHGIMSTRLCREQLIDPKLVLDEELHAALRAGVVALGGTPSARPLAGGSDP